MAIRESLKIDVEDLEAVPGWQSADGPLIGCINAGANAVLDHAIARAQEHAPMLDRKAAEQLLQVAFSCLAQLDDRGNVVRDFADLDRMLLASGVAERASPGERQDCRKALAAALEEFQKATLIGVKGNTYDVNHEALIRAWKKYRDWLSVARQRQENLVAVGRDAEMRGDADGRDGKPFGRWQAQVADWVVEFWTARRLVQADRIVEFETGAALQKDVFGPSRTFSDEWARRTLEDEKLDRPDGRLQAIKKTVYDAGRYRAHVWNQYRSALLLVAICLLFAVPYGLLYLYQARTIYNSHAQFELFRLATAVLSSGSVRQPREDLETFAAIYLASVKDPDDLPSGQTNVGLRATLQYLDEGVRQTMSDVSLRIASNEGNLSTDANDIDCIEVDPGEDQVLRARGRGIRSSLAGSRLGLAQASQIRSWSAFSKDVTNTVGSNLVNEVWPPGGIVCLSHDANWLFFWFPSTEGSVTYPLMRRIMWIRNPRADARDGDLHAYVTDFRRVKSAPSFNLAPTLVGALAVQRTRMPLLHNIRSFQVDDRAGFLVPLEDDTVVVVWTSTGFSDAEEASRSPDLVTCKETEEIVIVKCDLQLVTAEKHLVRVLVEHHRDTSNSVFPGESGPRCTNENRICSSDVRLNFVADDAAVRMLIRNHVSSRIKKGAFVDGYLWLEDESGQIWRYVVAAQKTMAVLQERWNGIEWNAYPRTTPVSGACRYLQCAQNVPEWPTEAGR